MNYKSFVNMVKERAHITNTRDALVAIEATLKTLGERLTEAEAAHLAAQLPPEIGRFLTVVDTNKSFDLETFYEHIAQREIDRAADVAPPCPGDSLDRRRDGLAR